MDLLLEREIEQLREQLLTVATQKKMNMLHPEVLELSQKLDVVLLNWTMTSQCKQVMRQKVLQA